MLAAVLLLALSAVAQLEVGDNTQMSLNGSMGFAYNGSIDQGLSGHSMGFMGDGHLSGSYYNPNFLNFTANPYYDRTQSNSVFGALTNARGVTSNVNLFSGSHFPGSVSFAENINGSGEFGVPGSAIGLAEHGNNSGFGVSWSALVPDWPTLTATYAIGDGTATIFGTEDKNSQSDHTFNLMSTYLLEGFRLNGGYTHRNVDDMFSQVLNGTPEPTESNSGSNNYQFNAQHSFPLQGSFSLGWNRSTYGYDYHDGSDITNSGGSDTVNGVLSFRPVKKLMMSFDANYNDSLLGSIPEPILNSGTATTQTSLGTFRSFLVGTDESYEVFSHVWLHATVNHQEQSFLGRNYSATQFGGSANFNIDRSLLKGLSFSLGVFDTAQQQANTGLGFVGNVNYNRKFDGWDVDANVSYAQHVQTVLLVYTTSSFGYVTNARRRLGNRLYFMAGYSGSHSGITANSGTTSSAQRVSSTLTYHAYSVNGFYSKSSGTAIFTPTGLVPVPGNLPPSILSPGSLIEYNSSAWGGSMSGTFMRRLNVNTSFAKSKGDTIDPLLSTFTSNDLINVVVQYRLRKIYVNGGYTHLRQSVGTLGTVPISVTTYYIGVSRWFNFF